MNVLVLFALCALGTALILGLLALLVVLASARRARSDHAPEGSADLVAGTVSGTSASRGEG